MSNEDNPREYGVDIAELARKAAKEITDDYKRSLQRREVEDLEGPFDCIVREVGPNQWIASTRSQLPRGLSPLQAPGYSIEQAMRVLHRVYADVLCDAEIVTDRMTALKIAARTEFKCCDVYQTSRIILPGSPLYSTGRSKLSGPR